MIFVIAFAIDFCYCIRVKDCSENPFVFSKQKIVTESLT